MPSADPPSRPTIPLGVARESEESRGLLQARVAEFGRLGMSIGLLFLGLSTALRLSVSIPGSRWVVAAQAGSVVIGALTWLLTRKGRFQSRALEWIDLGSTLSTTAVFVALGWALPLWSRPELIQLLCATDVLVLRAFLVPSTARRTVAIGCVITLTIAVSTWLRYDGASLHPDAAGALAQTAIAASIGLATVVLTALTSHTIFGLRQRVREATELGQYTLLEMIGQGGMGVVYRARHAMLRRQTAIKLLPVDRAGEQSLSRFEREAQLTSMLTHPNTVSIYDYGRTADGTLYYAMEYLDGTDLETLVNLDGPQPPGRVIHILRQIAGALEEAHGVGLIHRDVKPANVFLCNRKGSPDLAKVLDFGLVKSLHPPKDAPHISTDQIIGTPLFMSPEAIAEPNKVSPSSDLYGLGALGYYLLTGSPPFSGKSALDVCGQHLHNDPESPAKRLGRAPIALDRVLLHCLEKAPSKRPADAAALIHELDECRDSPTWQPADATAWWKQHDKALGAQRADTTSGIKQAATVAIDFRKRSPSTGTG